ncbi:glycosyltransferase family 4 protein [Methanolobus chelungpuianus]|uniref:Glycosyl transferase family 1 domain-containing protein n=1 Tax=Methanolobus chelungpuianus TaxID=502115 RepID=A0AAE3KY65_9EURY|nr:glycosyltransferase family 4 protein [Methanolobus chelungpuianus]MCQ6963412.1 hypothetical protein [Methanolobus chelungpuianus]
MNKNKDLIIGLISSPIAIPNKKQLFNLTKILSDISSHIYFITGNAGSDLLQDNKNADTYSITYNKVDNKLAKILGYIFLQIKISFIFLKIAKKANTWIFFHGSGTLLFPVFTAKILGKKIILMLPGSSKALKYSNDPFYPVVKILESINLKLSTNIIVYSSNLISEWGLSAYRKKILIAHEHFLDFDTFTITRKYSDRIDIVGYVGRLSEEKGILNLMQAIPDLILWNKKIRILIVGDGKLKNEIKSYLDEHQLNEYVNLIGWVHYNDLPNYLNLMKLLVLPSYSEGLPNVVLEAMACGTPVLTTPIGATLDIVKHNSTGFIMEENSSKCIAENIINAFNYPNIEQIIKNASNFVENEFSYENSVNVFEKTLNSIHESQKSNIKF